MGRASLGAFFGFHQFRRQNTFLDLPPDIGDIVLIKLVLSL